MTLSQHHHNQTRILVAETIFKGVFTKSKVISHLSDKVAPNELKSVLNELLNDKLVKVGEVKNILEIEESKLQKLRGALGVVSKKTKLVKPKTKVVKIKTNDQFTKTMKDFRLVFYEIKYVKSGVKIFYRFNYKKIRHAETIKLPDDYDIETIDQDALIYLTNYITNKYENLYKDFKFMRLNT